MTDLHLFFDPDAPVVMPEAVSFETGAVRVQVIDPNLWCYEHHGAEFGQADPGALTCFFEDILMGRYFPARFVARRLRLDTLVAIALFFHRDLVLIPQTSALVAQVDLLHRRGFPMLAHLDSDLGRFVRLLEGYFPDKLSENERNDRVKTAVGWVREYLQGGRLPSLGTRFPTPTVLETGAGGFVVAETNGSLAESWVELYRQGHQRGVLFGSRQKGTFLPALIARKSAFVALDLSRSHQMLNEAEGVYGGFPQWRLEGDWLWSPPEGSLILANEIVETVLGV